MRKIITITLMSILFCAVTSVKSYAELIVIVHPSNDASISEKDVERLFLGKAKSFSDGNLSIPINLQAGDDKRVQFDEKALGKSPSQMKAYWSKVIFTGKAQPIKEVNSDSEVIELVSKNPNAIGYVDSSSLNGSVKSVLSF